MVLKSHFLQPKPSRMVRQARSLVTKKVKANRESTGFIAVYEPRHSADDGLLAVKEEVHGDL